MAARLAAGVSALNGSLARMQSQAQGEINVYGVPRVGASRFGVEPEELLVGTHLIAHRRRYTHHRIYLGDARVVHYAARIKYPHGFIEEISLAQFSERRAPPVQ